MSLARINDVRVGELVRNLDHVRGAIAAAAGRSGRSASDITMIAVTKTWPVSDIRILSELGVMDVAENKAQELISKTSQFPNDDVRWHFVGQLQRNKVRQILPVVSSIQSVDRAELVKTIAGAVRQFELDPVMSLVQVNLDPEPVEGRAGVAPADALELAGQIHDADGLTLGGVMGVAPRGGDARAAFERLRQVSEEITDQYRSAKIISAGMSGDFVTAIEAGATHVRLGSALLGERAGFVR